MNALRSYATYKVISHSALDAFRIDHFDTSQEARAFAKAVSEEGYDALVCKVFEEFEAVDIPESYATHGIHYPHTLQPEMERVRL